MRIDRRQLLKLAGLGLASAPALKSFAGPFSHQNAQNDIPEDKKLDPHWVASLTERGHPHIYRKGELKYIGMPVGGILSGCVYLGGDGRLWLWDIFNQVKTGVTGRTVEWHGESVPPQNGAEYVEPSGPFSPFKQNFTLQIGDHKPLLLQEEDWENVEFSGQYPVGTIRYRQSDRPVEVKLEAYSYFVPLRAEDSIHPLVEVAITVTNHSDSPQKIALRANSENPVCLHSRKARPVRLDHETNGATLRFTASEAELHTEQVRLDRVIEDWSKGTYDGWVATGTAFGSRPLRRSEFPSYQGDLGGTGEFVANSHASAPGSDIDQKDGATGTLTSPPFNIDRDVLALEVGGGSHAGKTCVNLLVDGNVVVSFTGNDNNRMSTKSVPVKKWVGKTATLQLVDNDTGPWGNIGVGRIWLTDRPVDRLPLEKEPDYGHFSISGSEGAQPDAEGVEYAFTLKSKETQTKKFALRWNFPNLTIDGFTPEVSERTYGAEDTEPRHGDLTRLWRDTWYDSTLPHWFLDRTFANTSILATNTCFRIANGRFWAWEGVGCCAGTCTHVWQYAQAMARVFPSIEQRQREEVDLGLGFDAKTGQISMRAEHYRGPAVDGQAGTILRVLREHQMSADSAFLGRVWPHVKLATQWLIQRDPTHEGILEGPQDNTLDAAWYGKISWTSSLYVAALRAAAQMADEMNDAAFAKECQEIADRGMVDIERELFNGEYYIQKPDPGHPHVIGSYDCCHIDQVMGQGWAMQLGLPRVLPKQSTVTALKSLYKYNFTPNVGPYRRIHKLGRWYAVEGDGGLIMTTNPHGDPNPTGSSGADWQVGYFNECMSGFEYQAAAHMIAEGLVQEGLTVIRAIHDRYDGRLRNPYNEIECSDHYSRAMASYGAFIAACGFEIHGPKGHLGFAPKISPNDFRVPFIGATGWGTYAQQWTAKSITAELLVRFGKVHLGTFSVELPQEGRYEVSARVNKKLVPATLKQTGTRAVVRFAEPVRLDETNHLALKLNKLS